MSNMQFEEIKYEALKMRENMQLLEEEKKKL